jgi:4-hydroxy-tetrahydrodipicolinate synthase
MERFHGALTALVTPFLNGELDEKGLVDLIEFQIEQGIHGIVPCGTTGESATLDFDEHKRVIDLTVKTVSGRIPVIAGTGANNTLEAIELTESARESGADAVLSVAPYYNKPNQEGLYLHFKAIAEAVDIPVILYNVPGRTVIHILPETVAKLAQIPNIIGIKEACGSLEQISDVIRFCPDDFILLSGDDFTSMPTALVGGKGVISVVSNIDPAGMAKMMEAALAGDLKAANREHYRLFSLMKLMFKSPSPGPAKKALELTGRIQDGTPRLPMTPPDEQTTRALEAELTRLNMLHPTR